MLRQKVKNDLQHSHYKKGRKTFFRLKIINTRRDLWKEMKSNRKYEYLG